MILFLSMPLLKNQLPFFTCELQSHLSSFLAILGAISMRLEMFAPSLNRCFRIQLVSYVSMIQSLIIVRTD